tara:strand:+ start:2502 stop:3428 length:927 start_codon:yes stop_codon:yes gene_type:complete
MIYYSLKLFAYDELLSDLIKLDTNDKLPTRILLSGQEGIGKTSFALHLINYLLSQKETTKYNLEEKRINTDSRSYNLINNLSHPNFHCVKLNDGKKNIEIDQIRNAIIFLNKSSFDDNRKIVLIDGAEYLNLSSSNAILKSLEDSNKKNLFIITHNINKKLLETIKSRCITYKLNLDHSQNNNIIFEYFGKNLHQELHDDFKSIIISPKFLINHINFLIENKLELKSLDIESTIKYIIDNKSYKKSNFLINSFQSYIEIYFTKLYSKTKDYKYYENFINIVSENDLIHKFNLDLDSFFIKFENKYLKV